MLSFTCVNIRLCLRLQTDPPPLTAVENLLKLWSTISVIICAGSAFLVVCLLVVIIVYIVHRRYVLQHQHTACTVYTAELLHDPASRLSSVHSSHLGHLVQNKMSQVLEITWNYFLLYM